MQIKIGIIGSPNNVQRLLKVIAKFPTFDPVVRTTAHEEEILPLALELQREIEVLLLFGAQAQRRVKEEVHTAIPVHYVPLTGAGLYRALFSAAESGKLSGGLSVDSLTKAIVAEVLHDLGLTHIRFAVFNGPAHASSEILLAYHRNQVTSGACAYAITGVEEVARQLTTDGILNELLVPAEQDMSVSLERALLSTETRRIKESQIVVGMASVDEFGKHAIMRSSEHEVQKLKLDIHRMLLGYVESLDGYLTSLGGNEFLFFTTRGIFERETGGYKTIPLAKDINQSFGLTLSLGVGFGTSANEAGTHARTALRKSKEAGGNTCFIVREDHTLIGPIEMSDPVQTVLSPIHEELLKQAEMAGMTSVYLSRLLAQAAKFGKLDYKVHELAALLEVTVRSAHRLLLNWIDHGLVEVSGMEKVPRGRPRQIFRFTFLEEQPRG